MATIESVREVADTPSELVLKELYTSIAGDAHLCLFAIIIASMGSPSEKESSPDTRFVIISHGRHLQVRHHW